MHDLDWRLHGEHSCTGDGSMETTGEAQKGDGQISWRMDTKYALGGNTRARRDIMTWALFQSPGSPGTRVRNME